jgi:hypothetical protein
MHINPAVISCSAVVTKLVSRPPSVSESADVSGIKLFAVIDAEGIFSTFIESQRLNKKRLIDLDLYLRKSNVRYLSDRISFILDYIDTCERLACVFLEKNNLA